MSATRADLVAALQYELLFLECGGYRSTSCSWRPTLLLEDGPTCSRGETGGKCSEQSCPWFAFVPLRHHGEEIPCRHIVIGKRGETIDLLYRTATSEEYEDCFRGWLLAAIDRLEHLAALNDEPRKEEGDMEFICKGCGKRKGLTDEWLLALEFEKPGTEMRNMVILSEWNDKRALDPRAAHFCSLGCQKEYVAQHYARELVVF